MHFFFIYFWVIFAICVFDVLCMQQSNDMDKEMATWVSLFSVSRITGESSDQSHSNDDETFPKHVSGDVDITKPKNATMRYKDKKASR